MALKVSQPQLNAEAQQSIHKLVREIPKDNYLLVLGEAGVGKTTLSKDLASTSLKKHYRWVFRIELRNLLDINRHPENFSDDEFEIIARECFLYADKDDEEQPTESLQWMNWEKLAFQKHVKEAEQNGQVLYILDGHDEIAQALDDSSLIPAKVMPKLLQKQNVVITSRSYYLDKLRQQGRHIVNIDGFDLASQREYITRFFQHVDLNDKIIIQSVTERVQQFLEKNERLAKLCCTPINLELLCYTYHHFLLTRRVRFDENEITVGVLYTYMLDSLCRRYLMRPDVKFSKKNLYVLSAAGSEIFKECFDVLLFLGYLAIECLNRKNNAFGLTELIQKLPQNYQATKAGADYHQMIIKLLILGLVSSKMPNQQLTAAIIFNFNDPIFQYFFVARHFAESMVEEEGKKSDINERKYCLSIDGQPRGWKDWVDRYKFDDSYHPLIWVFSVRLLSDWLGSQLLYEDLLKYLLDSNQESELYLTANLLEKCVNEVKSAIPQAMKKSIIEHILSCCTHMIKVVDGRQYRGKDEFTETLRLSTWFCQEDAFKQWVMQQYHQYQGDKAKSDRLETFLGLIGQDKLRNLTAQLPAPVVVQANVDGGVDTNSTGILTWQWQWPTATQATIVGVSAAIGFVAAMMAKK